MTVISVCGTLSSDTPTVYDEAVSAIVTSAKVTVVVFTVSLTVNVAVEVVSISSNPPPVVSVIDIVDVAASAYTSSPCAA